MDHFFSAINYPLELALGLSDISGPFMLRMGVSYMFGPFGPKPRAIPMGIFKATPKEIHS